MTTENQTLNIESYKTTDRPSPGIPNLAAIKAGQKTTWEAGDYGQVAQKIENVAGDFMARRTLQRGSRVLDVACGTGNLALIAARNGCQVIGIDIADNLLAQARARAAAAGLHIAFEEADAEALPFADNTFDLTVSMFGLMFAPQPAAATAEFRRVTRPGGQIALANWTPEGFVGTMFKVLRKHLPPLPAWVPSPLEWGNEATVRQRLQPGFSNIQLTRCMAVMRYPFPPAETVAFFRKYFGPTIRAFESLPAAGQAALERDLVELQTRHNTAGVPGTTEVSAEYLEVAATKIGTMSRDRRR